MNSYIHDATIRNTAQIVNLNAAHSQAISVLDFVFIVYLKEKIIEENKLKKCTEN